MLSASLLHGAIQCHRVPVHCVQSLRPARPLHSKIPSISHRHDFGSGRSCLQTHVQLRPQLHGTPPATRHIHVNTTAKGSVNGSAPVPNPSKDWITEALIAVRAPANVLPFRQRSPKFPNRKRLRYTRRWPVPGTAGIGDAKDVELCGEGPLESEEPSIHRILARYLILTGSGESDHAFALSVPDQQLLQEHGYNEGQVREWARIIIAPDLTGALSALQVTNNGDYPATLPLFVLLYVLRRPEIKASALRIALRIAWGFANPESASISTPYISARSSVLLFVRLLRHARKVWPVAIDSVTELLLRTLIRPAEQYHRPNAARISALSNSLNSALTLSSLPTAYEPFKDVELLQASVVKILKHMADSNPPLSLNREGYRAVVRVQLALPKTAPDRQWAELKALSWPPWKEDRTQMDAEITYESHGVSPALNTLNRMEEDGYRPQEWEKAARIFAGWDVDDSPTIQHRVLLNPTAVALQTGSIMWAARIWTTRTAQEAWAAFLAYEDADGRPAQDVYLAIFTKLHEQHRLERLPRIASFWQEQRHKISTLRIFPGDVKEMSPLPPSTHLETYTRTPPPTMNELYETLRSRGVHFNGHCLAYLVSKAPSFGTGIDYLRNAGQRYRGIMAMLDPWDCSASDVDGVPSEVFAAFIELLGRKSGSRNPRYISNDVGGIHSSNALAAARRLLLLRSSFPPKSANSILEALGNHWRVLQGPREKLEEWPKYAEAFQIYESLFAAGGRSPDLDQRTLLAISHFLGNATAVGWRLLLLATTSAEVRRENGKDISAAIEFIEGTRGSSKLREALLELTGSDARMYVPGLPRLLAVPNPPFVNGYCRDLGKQGRYEELLWFLDWCVEHQDLLAEKTRKHRRSDMQLRRMVASVRVMMERKWLKRDRIDEDERTAIANASPEGARMVELLRTLESPAPEAVIDRARDLVESVEHWGGWASDEETDEYMRDRTFIDEMYS